MRPALLWIRNNPIAVVSMLLIIGSLVSLFVVDVQGRTFIDRMKGREGLVDEIKSYAKTNVTLPSANLDEAKRQQPVAVNLAAIQALRATYAAMNSEYRKIYDLAVKLNQSRHFPLIEGLFPSPGTADYKLYDARTKYLQAFEEMLLYYTPNAIYPRLHAGGPINRERLKEVADGVTAEFLSQLRPRRPLAELTAEEQAELARQQRSAVIQAMQKHASGLHIYAQTNPGQSDYPFTIGGWAAPGGIPAIEDVWEGQMDLWVQQDIVELLQNVNNVWDPQRSVLDAPVKRLHSIKPLEGYVGLNQRGGLAVFNVGAILGTPPSGDEKLPDDFSAGLSGRRSNLIYDVRHVWVVMELDFQRLPVFFEQLSKTNLMTILHMDLEEVDEYAALDAGYLYGYGDIVKTRMLIETLWLRDWTTRMMPPSIADPLGANIKPKDTLDLEEEGEEGAARPQ